MKCRHFVTSIEEKKLPFPSTFSERYGGELSERVSINTPDGREWSLGIERSGPSVWLDDGWPQFVAFYSIRPANGLFFKYKGASCFDVHVFTTTVCEIDYPGKFSGEEDEDDSSFEISGGEEDDDSSIEILGSPPCLRKDQPSHRENPESKSQREPESQEQLPKSSASVNKRRKVPAVKGRYVPQNVSDDDEGDLRPGHSRKGKNKLKPNCDNEQLVNDAYLRALGEAENPNKAAKMFKPANPSFTMALQSYHLRGRFAYIPKKFSKHLKYSMFVKLQVQVYGGRVHYLKATERRKGRGMNMGTGFSGFVRDNNLEEGDVIVFELIEPESAKLKAWIFHASSFRHGQRPLTKNQGTGCSMERPSSSGIKKSGKKKGKASVSDEPEQEGTKIYYSYRFPKSVKNASSGTKRALEAAQKLKSDNPRFIMILHATAFTNRRLYVPAGFCAIHLSRAPMDIEVQDCNGRQWSFLSTPEDQGGSYLTGVWTDFITENDLKQGDVCMFELIESRTVVLKVSAFHAEEEAEA